MRFARPVLKTVLTLAIFGVVVLIPLKIVPMVQQWLEDRQAAKFFGDAGAYAPTIGIIGTVMGLVHVLENLAQPEELGHLIAAAFIATLWGVMSANALWLPVCNRLKRLGELEAARMEVIVEGVAAIQAGSNPRVVAQKLRSLVSADQQDQAEAA